MLNTSIQYLPRTAVRTVQAFSRIGINTYADLLHYYPFRYDDFSTVSPIGRAQAGETVTLKGRIESIQTSYTRRRMTIQKAKLQDETGSIELIWYNQPYLTTLLKQHALVSVSGAIEAYGKTVSMKPQEYEIIDSLHAETKHTGRIVPIYPAVWGLSTKTIREKIAYLIQLLKQDEFGNIEYLPDDLCRTFYLPDLKQSLVEIHFPQKMKDVDEARVRLAFDELFIRILSSAIIKKQWQAETTTAPIVLDKTARQKIDDFKKTFPFQLTTAQNKAVLEILSDMQQKTPMNRFLQGDVGSGKTVVAAIAAYAAHLSGRQTLIMAPTEILATQHFQTISTLCALPHLKIALQTGSKKNIKSSADAERYAIIVGTQALISSKFPFKDVGLVVIDEQHRFGVKQRALVQEKGMNPHLLTMTATPIPRTVSLTLYSELDLSVIDEMPKGRKRIKTYVIAVQKRMDGYKWIEKQIKTKKIQAYIICPLIETSEKESMKSIKAAKDEYEHLKNEIFPSLSVALLHGKMKSKEKEKVMNDFKKKAYDILISTSVVEVGVDVPNATIMVIEGAERFGMAQLHQLRGRVGRGTKESHCFLFTSSPHAQYSKRLRFFAKEHSGLALSEFDLKIRGPGDVFGTKQHGYTDLKIADLTNTRQVLTARKAVDLFQKSHSLNDSPKLKSMIDAYQLHLVAKN